MPRGGAPVPPPPPPAATAFDPVDRKARILPTPGEWTSPATSGLRWGPPPRRRGDPVRRGVAALGCSRGCGLRPPDPRGLSTAASGDALCPSRCSAFLLTKVRVSCFIFGELVSPTASSRACEALPLSVSSTSASAVSVAGGCLPRRISAVCP